MSNYNCVLLMWFFAVYRPYAVIHTCAVHDKKNVSPLVPDTGSILLPHWPAVKNPMECLVLRFWFCSRPPGSWRLSRVWTRLSDRVCVWVLWHSWEQITFTSCSLSTTSFFLFPCRIFVYGSYMEWFCREHHRSNANLRTECSGLENK